MCGITGILTADRAEGDALTVRARRMADAIVHRGPDDQGVFSDATAGIALGFRRLAIVDLSAQGHQPMASHTARFSMVFNGEIYNFESLRAELHAQGVTFRGRSDTEVALAAFESWGIEAALQKFNGMFAMGIWDGQRRELTLARDRMGKKPLFIFRGPTTLLFGSELKALCADPAFERTIDRRAVATYLRFMCVPAPHCIYAGVEKLAPGHMITFERGNIAAAAPRPYWSLAERAAAAHAARPPTGNLRESTDEFRELLRDSVRLRMQADVPLGALLSGGIDSSLVVAVMSELASQPVQTFTIGFNDPRYNEALHARQVAEHLGTRHTELYLDGNDALALVPKLPDIFDEPLADPSEIPTYLVCQLARRHVTVALTGDGGDELFAGYHRYLQGAGFIRKLARIPHPLRAASAALLDSIPHGVWSATERAMPGSVPRLFGDKVRKTTRLLRQKGRRSMYRSLLSVWQDPAEFVRDVPRGSAEAAEHNGFAGAPGVWAGTDIMRAMMLCDQLGYLPDDLLAKLDRASMAVSLEARAPLLDYRVVEWSWQLSRNLLATGGLGKQVLRALLYEYVPRELVERPKMGFSVPIEEWLRGPLRPMTSDLLAPSSIDRFGVLDSARVGRAWSRFINGEPGDALGIWTLVMFQAWCERWLGSAQPGALKYAAA